MSRSSCSTGWCAGRGAIRTGTIFPTAGRSSDGQLLPIIARRSIGLNVVFALIARWRRLVPAAPHADRLPDRACSGRRRAPAPSPASASARMIADHVPDRPAASPALPASARSPVRSGSSRISVSPGYGFTAIIVAFLGRLNPIGILLAGFVLALVLSRRRGGAGRLRRLRPDRARLPGHAALLRARLRHPHLLPRAPGSPAQRA